MFEGLKNAWVRRSWSDGRSAPLKAWAQAHGLSFTPQAGGAYTMTGAWHGQPARMDCGAPSRPFIQGLELTARVDSGMSMPGNVVVLNRSLKHRLETWASELYAQYTDTLQTTAQTVPDEIRWLSMYRDAGWNNGPDRHFAARYAVLTDEPDMARHWIDADAQRDLMEWPGEGLSPQTPLMLMLLRGKAYLRMQIDQPRDTDTTVHAFELFRRFSERARGLMPSG